MVRTFKWRWFCAVTFALGMFVSQLEADDWLTSAADPKPPSFRAARYNAETHDIPAAAPARLRMDQQAEVVPAMETPLPQQQYEPIAGDVVEETVDGMESFVDEFGLLASGRAGQFIAGADYLNARPTFSEATAFARIENFTGNSRQELVQYDFAYNATPRVYLGYRRPDCNVELRFTYTQLQGDTEINSGEPVGDTVIILDPNLPVCSCTEVNARANVNANMYDIDLAKQQCFAPPCSAPTCGPSCNHPCQAWDVTYWMGIRIADVSWNSFGEVIDVDTQDLVATNEHKMSFTGAGPRVGINVRRNFGRTGRLAMFARCNLALLLGHYEITSTYFEAEDDDTDTNLLSRDRVIPVTEIEMGLSYNFRERTTVSAGYFLQAWHDLGMSQQITGQFPQGYDDANILSFDGLFVRGEWRF